MSYLFCGSLLNRISILNIKVHNIVIFNILAAIFIIQSSSQFPNNVTDSQSVNYQITQERITNPYPKASKNSGHGTKHNSTNHLSDGIHGSVSNVTIGTTYSSSSNRIPSAVYPAADVPVAWILQSTLSPLVLNERLEYPVTKDPAVFHDNNNKIKETYKVTPETNFDSRTFVNSNDKTNSRNVTKCHFRSPNILFNGTFMNCLYDQNYGNNITFLLSTKRKTTTTTTMAYRYFDPISEMLENMSDDVETGKCVPADRLCDLVEDCPSGLDESKSTEICGMMPTGSMCNFESDSCGWINEEIQDAMQWLRRNGPVYDESTGPGFDHTFQNTSGYYLLVTSWGGRYRPFDKAILRSPIFHFPYDIHFEHGMSNPLIQPNHQRIRRDCKIRFWYHMFGPHTGGLELKVYYNSPGTNANNVLESKQLHTIEDKIWKIFNRDEDEWIYAEVPIFRQPYIPQSFYVEFISWRGVLEKGDVAIDDVSLTRNCFIVPESFKSISSSKEKNSSNNKNKNSSFIVAGGTLDSRNKTHDETDVNGSSSSSSSTMLLQINVLQRQQLLSNESVKIFQEISAINVTSMIGVVSSNFNWKFDNCKNDGPSGPYLPKCVKDAVKPLQSFHKIVGPTIYSGIQLWVVPKNGTYRFNLTGGDGGKGVLNREGYGRAAKISGMMKLFAGEMIFILVGQKGQDACQALQDVQDHENYDLDKDPHEYYKLCRVASATTLAKTNPHSSKMTQDQEESTIFIDYYKRRKLSGGGGGGGGATYVFKYEARTQTLIPLIVSAGGGGSSALPTSSDRDLREVDAKFTFLPTTLLSSKLEQGKGFANSNVSGAGGGWYDTEEQLYTFSLVHGINNLTGMNLVNQGSGGGRGQICGNYLKIISLKKKLAQFSGRVLINGGTRFVDGDENYLIWPVNGGFGGGGAACSSGGSGGGFKGGDAPVTDSVYRSGRGGTSFANPFHITNVSSEIESPTAGHGLVTIEALLAHCPCSLGSCHLIDPFDPSPTFECVCPPGMILSHSTLCIPQSAVMQLLGTRRMTVLLVMAGLIAFALTCAIICAILTFNRRKVLRRGMKMNPKHFAFSSSSTNYLNGMATNELGGGPAGFLSSPNNNNNVLDVLDPSGSVGGYEGFDKKTKALWDALQHELQLDRIRLLSNRIPDSVLFKRIMNFKNRLFDIPTPTNVVTSYNGINEMGNKSSFNLGGGSEILDGTSTIQTTFSNKNDSFHNMSRVNTTSNSIPISYKYASLDYTSFDDKFEDYKIIEIPRDKLKLIKALGEGAFGEVFQGILKDYPITTEFPDRVPLNDFNSPKETIKSVEVAVKTLPENCQREAEIEFLVEASLMSKFNHPNIVKLYGACLKNSPKFLILEYLPGGDLKNFLREIRLSQNQAQKYITVLELLHLALDISKGCQYLEQNHFVHRDIAARNCLLTTKLLGDGRIAKIADFGMSRDIYNSNYYRKSGKAMLPVKWMPPEAYLDGLFTSKSDVWSFGVLLWELFTLGYMPYPGKGNQEVMVIVTKGERLKAPNYCPLKIRELMSSCWHNEPEGRPNFDYITKALEICLEDEDISKFPAIPVGAVDLSTGISLETPSKPLISQVKDLHRLTASAKDVEDAGDAFISENDTNILPSPSLVFPESSSISGSGSDSRQLERKIFKDLEKMNEYYVKASLPQTSSRLRPASCSSKNLDLFEIIAQANKRGTKLSKTSQSTSGIGGSSMSGEGSNCGDEDSEMTLKLGYENYDNASIIKNHVKTIPNGSPHVFGGGYYNLTDFKGSQEYLVPKAVTQVESQEQFCDTARVCDESAHKLDLDSDIEGYENMVSPVINKPINKNKRRILSCGQEMRIKYPNSKPNHHANYISMAIDPSYMIFTPIDFPIRPDIKRVRSVPCDILQSATNANSTPSQQTSVIVGTEAGKVTRHHSRPDCGLKTRSSKNHFSKRNAISNTLLDKIFSKTPNANFEADPSNTYLKQLIRCNGLGVDKVSNYAMKPHNGVKRSKSNDRKSLTIAYNGLGDTVNSQFYDQMSRSTAEVNNHQLQYQFQQQLLSKPNKIVKSRSFNQHLKHLLNPIFNKNVPFECNKESMKCQDYVGKDIINLIQPSSFANEIKVLANHIEDELIFIE